MMWTKLALVGVIIAGALLWLAEHDKQVKAKALAEQRRKSLYEAAIVIAANNLTIDSVQREVKERNKKLVEKDKKLYQQTQELDSLQKLDEDILEAIKGEIQLKPQIPRSQVIRLVEKYEDYIDRLNRGILVRSNRIENLTWLYHNADSLYKLETEKSRNLESINQSLLQELNKPVEVKNSASIWTVVKYVVPSVLVTYCIAECFDGNERN